MYIGVLPVLAAFLYLGCFRAYKSQESGVFVVLLITTLVLAIGAHNPAYRLLYTYVPGFKSVSDPGRLVMVHSLFLALISAKALEYLSKNLPEITARQKHLVCFLAIIVCLCATISVFMFTIGRSLLTTIAQPLIIQRYGSTAAEKLAKLEVLYFTQCSSIVVFLVVFGCLCGIVYVLGGEEDNLNGFYGLGRTMNRAKWLHQAWWRYAQARWGYSPNIHSWELTNEGDPWLTEHYELTDEMGKYMHCTAFGAAVGAGDGQKCGYKHPNAHLVTTSFWTSFPATQFWKNASYPNVDYADLHAYISTSDIGIPSAELAKMQWDSAYYHLGHSKEIGGWKLGKPAVRGEAGIDSTSAQEEQPDLAKDTQGIWLHKFLWSTLDSGAMPELYWWRMNIEEQPGPDGVTGLYEIFGTFNQFLKGIPVNNGHFADAQATASDSRLRVVGQKDVVNGRAHLWIDNSNHTWKNVVDRVAIAPLTGTIAIPNMPAGTYDVTWHDTYNGTTTNNTVTVPSGSITLNVSGLAADTAVKVVKQ